MPFLSTRNPDSRRDSWMAPARRTISDGGGEENWIGPAHALRQFGSGRGALHHHHLHPAFRRALQVHFVHEAANQEDAAAAAFQEILRRQRVGHRCGVEPGAFVAHADVRRPAGYGLERRELDVHPLASVVPVAVFDGVDDRLAHGDVDPVPGLLVEAGQASDVVADDLHQVEHLEGAVEIQANGLAAAHSGAANQSYDVTANSVPFTA